MTYTTKLIHLNNFETEHADFIFNAGLVLEKNHPGFKWKNFNITKFLSYNYLNFCYRDERPVGFLAASFSRSFFDSDIVTLRQNLLYSLPNTRASLLLLKDFIDFGKVNANHVITTIGPWTNIKRQSLEKLGFSKLEETFRMET